MANTLVSRLQGLMVERGFNPTSLARAAGLGVTAIRDILEERVRSPRVDTVSAVAGALGVSLNWLLTGDEEARVRVPIVGIVSAGDGWIAIDGDPEYVDFQLGGDDTIAVEIRGDSMEPAYRSNDLLICPRVRGRRVVEMINRDCVVETTDGRHYVKILKRGTRAGLFTLKSYNIRHDDIENVSISWAAPVRWILRRS